MAQIRLKVFKHIEKVSLGYFESTHSGDSISRLTNDIATIENAYAGNIRSIVTLIFTGVYSAVIMLFLDWRIASALILLGVVSTFVNAQFAEPIRKLSDVLQQNAGKLTERLSDLLTGFNTVKLFPIKDILFGKYNAINYKIADITVARSTRYAFLDCTNFLLGWVNNGGTFIVGTAMMLYSHISLGTVLGMVLLLQNVTSLFCQLGSFISNLQSSMAGAARIFELLDMPIEPDKHAYSKCSGDNAMIGMENVVFGYRDGKRVINGLSFNVEKGRVAALVGPSGGGKSTVIKLLLGLYPIEDGCININGRAMGDYTLSQLRDLIAYVPQDAQLFEGTIEENIRYGRLGASHDEVAAAAKMANAHDFIVEQPEGISYFGWRKGCHAVRGAETANCHCQGDFEGCADTPSG